MNKLWSTELKVEDIQVLDKSGDGGGEYYCIENYFCKISCNLTLVPNPQSANWST